MKKWYYEENAQKVLDEIDFVDKSLLLKNFESFKKIGMDLEYSPGETAIYSALLAIHETTYQNPLQALQKYQLLLSEEWTPHRHTRPKTRKKFLGHVRDSVKHLVKIPALAGQLLPSNSKPELGSGEALKVYEVKGIPAILEANPSIPNLPEGFESPIEYELLFWAFLKPNIPLIYTLERSGDDALFFGGFDFKGHTNFGLVENALTPDEFMNRVSEKVREQISEDTEINLVLDLVSLADDPDQDHADEPARAHEGSKLGERLEYLWYGMKDLFGMSIALLFALLIFGAGVLTREKFDAFLDSPVEALSDAKSSEPIASDNRSETQRDWLGDLSQSPDIKEVLSFAYANRYKEALEQAGLTLISIKQIVTLKLPHNDTDSAQINSYALEFIVSSVANQEVRKAMADPYSGASLSLLLKPQGEACYRWGLHPDELLDALEENEKALVRSLTISTVDEVLRGKYEKCSFAGNNQ